MRNSRLTYFVQKANEYKSRLWIEAEERQVNAKSLLGVLALALVPGSQVKLTATGEDAEQALNELSVLLQG